MKPLTPEEKIAKRQRDAQKILHNQVLSAFNFGKIKTWGDLYHSMGYDNQYLTDNKIDANKPITYPEAKAYLASEKEKLEYRLAHPTLPPPTKPNPKPHEEKEVTVKSLFGITKEKEVPVVEKRVGEVKEEEKTIQQTETPAPQREVSLKVDKFSAANNYGFTPSPNERFSPYWYQKKAIAELVYKITVENKTGLLLIAPTGSGKTHMTYGTERRLLDMGWHEDKTFSHTPYLVLTKSTIVEQHKRTAKNYFNIDAADTEITNIETLRSSEGEQWIREKVRVVDGEEQTYYEWKKLVQPAVVFFDESQGAKNKSSKQSQCIYAYNNLPPKGRCLVCISATPFTRVSEARAFAVSTGRLIDHLGFPPGTRLTNDTWPAYASIIAAPSRPDEYNSAAVGRLIADLEDWIVRVRGVKPQFDADNGIEVIQFESDAKRKYYNETYDRLVEELAKINAAKEAGEKETQICYLVVLLKWAMAAELCHADNFAKMMYEDVQAGYAAVSAIKFKQTLIQIVKILNEKYSVPRSQISLIWGGGQTQLTKKQKAKQKIKDMAEKFKGMGLDVDELLTDTGLDEVEDRILIDLPEHLNLGQQTIEDRQVEIDNFQKGKTVYCIYTLKAGGVGLSLPHSDEFTTDWNRKASGFDEWYKMVMALPPKQRPLLGKCRRKESGYVYEEDIPFIPTRPRKTNVTITYNAIELVQGVGRVPRVNSLSTTVQRMRAYAGTVEVEMVHVCAKKFKCISAVVKQKEDWQDIITTSAKDRERIVNEHIDRTKDLSADESSLIDEGDEADEEDGD